VESRETAWRETWQRELLRSVLMTTCDIAAITKPWRIQLRAANLVLSEFFDQGDREKHQLKIQPQVWDGVPSWDCFGKTSIQNWTCATKFLLHILEK